MVIEYEYNILDIVIIIITVFFSILSIIVAFYIAYHTSQIHSHIKTLTEKHNETNNHLIKLNDTLSKLNSNFEDEDKNTSEVQSVIEN